MHQMNRIAALGAGLALMAIAPAHAQQAERTKELYHIFDIRPQADRQQLIRALTDGININASDSETVTPLIRGAPPEQAGTFELVDPFADGRLGGFAAMLGAAQQAQVKQVKCDGAVWIANAARRICAAEGRRACA